MPSIPHTDDPVLLFIAERVNNLGENLSDLNASVTGLHTKHEAFEKELLGNGQPGRIQRIESDHSDLSKKVSGLEKKIWYASGGFAVAAVIIKSWFSKVFGLAH